MRNDILKKSVILVVLNTAIGIMSWRSGLSPHQALSITVFSISILGTLFFWEFRLSFAFLGTSILIMTRAIDLEHLIKFASLEIILFLIGMMVLVGFLKEAGFFGWLISLIIRIRHLTAKKFIISISVLSALLACAIDEVTSIIFIVALVLEICDYFEVDPIPYIIISVLATNIGSAGTVLGNPIGILIASKAGLSFEDFLVHAFPVMCVALLVMILIVLFWYRRELSEFDEKVRLMGDNEFLIRLVSVPPGRRIKIGLSIFGLTLFFIMLHHRLELLWNLERNSILLVVPLISSGCVMIYKHESARKYIERDVEWWTLLFFMLLFAQAGVLKYTGATDLLAKRVVSMVGNNPSILTGFIIWISAIGSSLLDNVVLVAAFIPVVQSFQGLGLEVNKLWWALLFGGCLGGNITLVGSTANIVALGILEKERNYKMTFLKWFKIGLLVGIATTVVAWLFLLI